MEGNVTGFVHVNYAEMTCAYGEVIIRLQSKRIHFIMNGVLVKLDESGL